MTVTAATTIGQRLPEGVRRFGPAWMAMPWGVMGAVVAAALVSAGPQRGWAAWPFLISVWLLGMPHGALDLKLWWQGLGTGGRRWRAAGVYLAVMAAALAVLWVWPWWTLLGFVVLTVVHFGSADARDAAWIAGGERIGGVPLWLTAAGRGGFLLALPFVWEPSGAMVPAVVAGELLHAPAPGFDPSRVRLAGAVGVGLGAALCFVGALMTWGRWQARDRDRNASGATGRCLAVHGGEMSLLALAAAALEPMLFVGVYFLGWHALRHFRRVDQLTGQPAPPFWPSLGRQHLAALPLLLPTNAVYLAVGASVIGWRDPMAWAVLLLLFFVVLTPAHHLLVERAIARAWRRS